ncbi:hypothetical protein I4I78_18270 [Pseudonocardia sp. KRD-291]|nr:hypothetical protein [Pseudonocardia sp. KRD291]
MDEDTVAGLDKLTEALETIERARGSLYTFHQLTGYGDDLLDPAVAHLRRAGHHDLADTVETELIGRNVLAGRWTFQIVEEYDEGYYQAFRDIAREATERLAGGRTHLDEARTKERRRTRGRADHRATP